MVRVDYTYRQIAEDLDIGLWRIGQLKMLLQGAVSGATH